KFSVSVEGDVVIIPLTGSEEFAVFRIRIHSENKTAGRLIASAEAIAVLRPAKEQVVGVILMRGIGRKVLRQFGEVAADHIEHLVRAEHEAMGAMFAG